MGLGTFYFARVRGRLTAVKAGLVNYEISSMMFFFAVARRLPVCDLLARVSFSFEVWTATLYDCLISAKMASAFFNSALLT